jgi:hypothetical protein
VPSFSHPGLHPWRTISCEASRSGTNKQSPIDFRNRKSNPIGATKNHMQERHSSSAKIASSASISSVSSLLNSWPIASSNLETSAPSVQKYPSEGDRSSSFQASNRHESRSESVAIDLLAAASRESANGEAGPRRAGQPRMRSSIACARCRRSKIKCLNSGVNTTCRACQVSGRECTYPAPVLGDRSSRRESSVIRTPGEAGAPATDVRRIAYHPVPISNISQSPKQSRPRLKKGPVIYHGVSTSQSMRALVDALDPILLTPQVWIELVSGSQHHAQLSVLIWPSSTFGSFTLP